MHSNSLFSSCLCAKEKQGNEISLVLLKSKKISINILTHNKPDNMRLAYQEELAKKSVKLLSTCVASCVNWQDRKRKATDRQVKIEMCICNSTTLRLKIVAVVANKSWWWWRWWCGRLALRLTRLFAVVDVVDVVMWFVVEEFEVDHWVTCDDWLH